MELRLHGTPDEVDQAAEQLADVFDVVSVSTHRPDRGASRLVRVYLHLRLTPLRHGGALSPLARAEAAKGLRDLPDELSALVAGERDPRAQPWYPLQPGDVALSWLPGIGHGDTYLATRQPDAVGLDGAPMLRQVSTTTPTARPLDVEHLGDSDGDGGGASLFELWFEAGPATLAIIRAGRVVFGQPAHHHLPNRGEKRGQDGGGGS
jgi:hypothetical protein